MHLRVAGQVELEELTQVGYFGLVHALEHFDPGRNFKFETFAQPRIWGQMVDELRNRDDVPRLARTHQKHVTQATDRLRQELGHEPNSGDFGEAANLDGAAQLELERQAQAPREVSISKMLSADDAGRDVEVSATLVDAAAVDPAQHAELVDELRKVLRGCSKTERLILLLYYCEGRTMREISLDLDLSESRVSQLHGALVARLRALHAPSLLKQGSRRTRASNKDRKYVARRIA